MQQGSVETLYQNGNSLEFIIIIIVIIIVIDSRRQLVFYYNVWTGGQIMEIVR